LEGNSAAEKVVQRIEGDRDFVIELAQDLVRIPSVNPNF
jgi:acetylornithine deacetylase/succinyl-diaminopimelate desuccinylase-like protein